MAGLNQKATPEEMVIVLPTVAAASAATFAIFNPSFAGEIVSVNLSNKATVTSDGTSYTTLTLVDNTTTTHTLATLTTKTGGAPGVALTIDTFSAFTLNATNTNKRFNVGDAIVLVKAESGGGATITTPTLWIEYIAGTYDS